VTVMMLMMKIYQTMASSSFAGRHALALLPTAKAALQVDVCF